VFAIDVPILLIASPAELTAELPASAMDEATYPILLIAPLPASAIVVPTDVAVELMASIAVFPASPIVLIALLLASATVLPTDNAVYPIELAAEVAVDEIASPAVVKALPISSTRQLVIHKQIRIVNIFPIINYITIIIITMY
jgi:hypothetical protein